MAGIPPKSLIPSVVLARARIDPAPASTPCTKTQDTTPAEIPFAPATARAQPLQAPATKSALSSKDSALLQRGLQSTTLEHLASQMEAPAMRRAVLAMDEVMASLEPYSEEELKDLIYEQLRDDDGNIDYTSEAIPLLRKLGDTVLLKQVTTRAGEGAADFALGVIDGVQPNPNAPRTTAYFGHTAEHTLGQMLGATAGMLLDAAGLATGLAGMLVPPAAAVATGGALAPAAAPVVAASAALVGASVLAGRSHAKHLGDALQSYANEAQSTEPRQLRPHRDTPRIEDGNSKGGWQHIDERHVSGTNPGGDLFPKETTRADLETIAKSVVRKGARRTEDPARQLQVFDKRMRIKNVWCDVRVVADSWDSNRVITMFPLKGTCK